MIFSLLKLRKKTSTTLAGVVVAVTCLWGMALWQGISREEMISLALGSVFLLLGIMFFAALIITLFKAGSYLIGRLINQQDD